MNEETVIAIVEDDPNIADLVELYLRREGYRPYQATTGERALEIVEQRDPRLLLLDIGLAGEIDGLEVCRRVRASSAVPIIFLTARDDEVDRVLGLELGADDYITKPFSPRELVARVKAILRRTEAGPTVTAAAIVAVGEHIVVDRCRREVTRRGEPVPLATREFDLLHHLAAHAGLALSRRQLIDGVWATTGSATTAPSTSTSVSSARSSAPTSTSSPSGASAIGSTHDPPHRCRHRRDGRRGTVARRSWHGRAGVDHRPRSL